MGERRPAAGHGAGHEAGHGAGHEAGGWADGAGRWANDGLQQGAARCSMNCEAGGWADNAGRLESGQTAEHMLPACIQWYAECRGFTGKGYLTVRQQEIKGKGSPGWLTASACAKNATWALGCKHARMGCTHGLHAWATTSLVFKATSALCNDRGALWCEEGVKV
eukprot:366012-Chlamydomonas_euryale.AAC.27